MKISSHNIKSWYVCRFGVFFSYRDYFQANKTKDQEPRVKESEYN